MVDFHMETVIGVEGNEEVRLNEGEGDKFSSSASQSPGQFDDSVVYKLVRVQGDGRFVPATEDEVMEVEDLLEDDKMEIDDVEDSVHTTGCITTDGPFSEELPIESSKGLLDSDNTEVDADILNARLEGGDVSKGEPGREALLEIVSTSPLSLSGSHANQNDSISKCFHTPDEQVLNVPSASKPLLHVEICLDNLSIKELQETFKGTFGRETTVKDKQWLKRRLSMGLTNSCDVSTTTFIIRNKKWTPRGKEEITKYVDGSSINEESCKSSDNSFSYFPVSDNNQMENCQNVGGETNERLGGDCIDHGGVSDDLQSEQRGAKRARKPTRRYIEELSEVEPTDLGEKLLSLDKNSGFTQRLPTSQVTTINRVNSVRKALVCRLDSFGGSGVQIPYVSRGRRSRPRKSVMAFMTLHPGGIDMATKQSKLLKTALSVHNSQPENEIEDEFLKATSPQMPQQPVVVEPGKDLQCPTTETVKLESKVDLKQVDSSGDASDDNNIVTVPTAKGGFRRKHHRPWSITEVMKLVEGVSKFGAGRWSEIKRLSFASHSYRTSVDLKDKWRNLLRASCAQTPPDNVINARKHAATPPIPAQILLRVRELAKMHPQVPSNLSSSKMAGSVDRNVHETRSGYL